MQKKSKPHSLKQISRDADIALSRKAIVTVKLKDAFNENYQNHNSTFADTCGNYCNTKFVINVIAIAKNYRDNR